MEDRRSLVSCFRLFERAPKMENKQSIANAFGFAPGPPEAHGQLGWSKDSAGNWGCASHDRLIQCNMSLGVSMRLPCPSKCTTNHETHPSPKQKCKQRHAFPCLCDRQGMRNAMTQIQTLKRVVSFRRESPNGSFPDSKLAGWWRKPFRTQPVG